MNASIHSSRPCPRTQMSRTDRIARIVRRAVQRCTCEINGVSQPRGARRER